MTLLRIITTKAMMTRSRARRRTAIKAAWVPSCHHFRSQTLHKCSKQGKFFTACAHGCWGDLFTFPAVEYFDLLLLLCLTLSWPAVMGPQRKVQDAYAVAIQAQVQLECLGDF